MNTRQVAASTSTRGAAHVTAHLADAVSAFVRIRSRLFGVAYRMLGDPAEAEDVVQDVWIRWQTTDQSRVRNPPAFLVATTTRLAINVLQSARARREDRAAECSTEAIDTSADPASRAEQAEALNRAVLLLLEKLSPIERAAYVLREAFSYPYRAIADLLRMKEANVRQLVTRARTHVSGGRCNSVNPVAQRCLVDALLKASRTGDLVRLESCLVADIASHSAGR